jgi:hypothetical protein
MIIAWIVACFIVASIGKKTSWGYGGIFFCSLFLSPIVGMIAVMVLPKEDPKKPKPQRGYLTGKKK